MHKFPLMTGTDDEWNIRNWKRISIVNIDYVEACCGSMTLRPLWEDFQTTGICSGTFGNTEPGFLSGDSVTDGQTLAAGKQKQVLPYLDVFPAYCLERMICNPVLSHACIPAQIRTVLFDSKGFALQAGVFSQYSEFGKMHLKFLQRIGELFEELLPWVQNWTCAFQSTNAISVLWFLLSFFPVKKCLCRRSNVATCQAPELEFWLDLIAPTLWWVTPLHIFGFETRQLFSGLNLPNPTGHAHP